MAQQGRKFPFMRSVRSLQDNVTQSAPAAAAAYSMIGALLLLGAAGYGIDRWAKTEPWGVLTGLLLGMAVGFWELVRATTRK